MCSKSGPLQGDLATLLQDNPKWVGARPDKEISFVFYVSGRLYCGAVVYKGRQILSKKLNEHISGGSLFILLKICILFGQLFRSESLGLPILKHFAFSINI